MRRILILAPLALSVTLLAGCSAAPAFMSGSDEGMSAPSAVEDLGTSANSEREDGATGSASLNVAGPRIITTVDLRVTVKDPLTAADDAANVADKFGGSVAYRTENAATDYSTSSAQMTLRIPSESLNRALTELKSLGVVQETSVNAVDVTAESTDLAARITSLQTSVDRLLTLMSQATSTENLLAVESALSQRQADLESLQAQKRNLDDQVSLSTVHLNLVSERDTPAPEPDNFWTGLVAGWTGFVAFWAGVLVAFGVLVPWLVAAGLITAVILIWVKLARRRRRSSANATSVDAANATSEPTKVSKD